MDMVAIFDFYWQAWNVDSLLLHLSTVFHGNIAVASTLIALALFSLIFRYWVVAIAALGILAVFAFSPRPEEIGIYVMLVVSMAALTMATWQQRSMVRTLASVESQVSGMHQDVDSFLEALEKRTRVLDATKIEVARI